VGVRSRRKINSHKEKGLGAWSDDEIKRAITKGVRQGWPTVEAPMGFGVYATMTTPISTRWWRECAPCREGSDFFTRPD